MSLRPTPAAWFEAFVPRTQTVYALEALGTTGQVQLDRDYVDRPLQDTGALRDTLQAARALTRRHAALLPRPSVHDHLVAPDPDEVAADALRVVRSHLARLLRLRRQRHDLDSRIHRLRVLRRCIHAMGDDADDLARFGDRGHFLCRAVFACPTRQATDTQQSLPDSTARYSDAVYRFYAMVCLPEERDHYCAALSGAGCEPVMIPPWLPAHGRDRERRLQHELQQLKGQRSRVTHRLTTVAAAPALRKAMTDLAMLDWYLDHTVTLSGDNHHCRITGWTTAAGPEALQRVLKQARIDARLLFRPTPPGQVPPVALAGSPFSGLFRPFVHLVGSPGADEVDPTALVAVLVPVLFGFMFPDLGHGLVLAVASLAGWKRFPRARFLLPCGLSSAAFGILFGEFFGIHLPPPAGLVCPLEQPLLVLLGSIGLGACILLLGLGLSAIEASWRGELDKWIWLDGAVLVLYVCLLVGVFVPPALGLAAVALGWYLVGLAVTRHALLRGLGRLVHSALELCLNTLSFARVGAFAIAHAALTHVLLEVTAPVEDPTLRAVLLVAGHGAIIAVEGLAVLVQTTRLVLFEFFTRFLRGDGRLFRPLRPV